MYPIQSPFVRRALANQLPATDLTQAAPGTKCWFCGLPFTATVNRNIHIMRRHADRRQEVIR